MNGSSVLVAGGADFVGRALARRLGATHGVVVSGDLYCSVPAELDARPSRSAG